MILAIDVGNTLTKLGLWNGFEWTNIERRRTSEIAGEDSQTILETLASQARQVVGCSVVPDAAQAIDGQISVKWLRADNACDMPIRYGPPWSVGTDRIANALALRQGDCPALAVDIGSAVNFDAVDASGAFVGGAILPGPALWLRALAKETAQLPEGAMDVPATPIGQTTLQSLQSGLFHGLGGALDHLVREICAELQRPKFGEVEVRVAITGGYSRLFADGLLAQDFVLHGIKPFLAPNLTLDGLIRFAEWESNTHVV